MDPEPKAAPMTSGVQQPDDFESWHAFFDTCQLLGGLFPSDNKPVREALRAADALTYVPGLVLEERVVQGADRERLRSELAKHAQITPEGGTIDEATKLRFFAGRSYVRFRDAAIVLSVIDFASAAGLRACVFVTEDKKLRRDKVLPRIADLRGISLLFRTSEDLISLLREAPPTLWKANLFVRTHIAQINRYLDDHPEIKSQLVAAMLALSDQGLTEVASIETDRIEAFRARFGGAAPNLETVSVESLPDEVIEVIPEEKFQEGRPIPVLLRLGVNLDVRGFTAVSYELEARATMQYQGGAFVEPFEVESIVVPPDAIIYG